jgi:WD40 repeat protein
LGVAPFEADPQVIQAAAERQIVHVSGHRLGQWSTLAQRLLNELAVAKISLLQPETKAAYDAELRERLAGRLPDFELPTEDSLAEELPAAGIHAHDIAALVKLSPPVVPPAVPVVVDAPPIAVEAPPVVAPPIVEPGQHLDWPAPLAGGTAQHPSDEQGSARPFYLNGILLIALVSAAAAIGGAVFLAVVLRQIDRVHELADAQAAPAPALDEDAANKSADAAVVEPPPAGEGVAAPRAKQRKRPAKTRADVTAGEMEAPAASGPETAPGGSAPGDAMPDGGDAGDKPAAAELPLVYRENGTILHVAISPDGHEAVSVAQLRRPALPNSVRFWSMEDGTQISRDLNLPPDVTAISYSAGGRELFVGTASGKASVISLDSGEVLALGRGTGPLTTVVATGNDAFLFVRPNQSVVEGWDHGHNVLRVACESLRTSPGCLAVSADNTALLTASLARKLPARKGPEKKAGDNQPAEAGAPAAALQLWDVQPVAVAGGAANERIYRAALKFDLTEQLAGLSSAALTADARQILFAGSDGEIHVWDVESRGEVRKLSGHRGVVTCMALSSDGLRMVSGSDDHTVRAWAVAEGIELMRYDGHTQRVRSVAIAADGRMAVSGGADGQLRIWRLPAARAVERIVAVAAEKPVKVAIFEPGAAVAAPTARLAGGAGTGLERPPVGTAHQRAIADLKKLFRLEFAAAKDPESRLELAVVLLNESSNYPQSYRFAMLDEARSLATGSGNLGLALSAIRALAEQFEIDTAQMTAETLEQMSHQPLLPEVRQQLAAASLAAAEESLAGEKYSAARKLLAVAVAAARKGSDARLTAQIADRASEATELQKSFERFAAGQKVLADRPDDAAARLAVGKYLCFVRRDWAAGLPHLAGGDNAALQALAQQELAGAPDAADMVKLADAWWKLAQAAKGKERADFLARSRQWYQAALPELTGLTETRVAQRLEELDAQEVARARGR